MKLTNETNWSESFLRRMQSWVCETIEFPVLAIKEAKFGNAYKYPFSGRAYVWQFKFVVSIGPESTFPCSEESFGLIADYLDRLDALVMITAHEIFHLKQRKDEVILRSTHDEIEQQADWQMIQTGKVFREKRESLTETWSKPDITDWMK